MNIITKLLTFLYKFNFVHFNSTVSIHHLVISHFICIFFFTAIYYKLFENIDKHYIINDKITKEEYNNNRLINSFYISVNIQSTTGYIDINIRSPLARLITCVQLILSICISLGVIYFARN
jgi:hypothetical protein